jgi:hypothetical protein
MLIHDKKKKKKVVVVKRYMQSMHKSTRLFIVIVYIDAH